MPYQKWHDSALQEKGDQRIELDTVRWVRFGRTCVLDGNHARLQEKRGRELMKFQLAFEDILKRISDWLKILLRRYISRLRTAAHRSASSNLRRQNTRKMRMVVASCARGPKFSYLLGRPTETKNFIASGRADSRLIIIFRYQTGGDRALNRWTSGADDVGQRIN